MSDIKLMPEMINRLNSFLIHLILIYGFCLFLQGGFLFSYPTLLILWLFISFFMSQFHYFASKYLRANFFCDTYIVSLWLIPLLYMVFGILTFVTLLYVLDSLSLSGCIRQTLQLDLQSYSKSIYLYVLLLVSSGTLLFVQMSHQSIPLLQGFHHSKKSQKITRYSLVLLFSFILISSFYLSIYAKNNLFFIKAYFQSVYSNDSYKPLKSYETIKKEYKSRLYFNARLKMAKMSFRRFKNNKKSLLYLNEIIESNSKLKDDALLEKIRVLLSISNELIKIKTCVKKLRKLKSCLLDEALFLYAKALKGEKKLKEASLIYEELKSMFYTLTIISYTNSNHLDYAFCSDLAKKKLNEIEIL
ncbi:MAG: hypothetical protein COB02_11430 [Candidatus Cloacimonadota bacterium]|nr:MAG: hypothetical protein COB02_11430 [Candidatus Cloacimonadota bacterium]